MAATRDTHRRDMRSLPSFGMTSIPRVRHVSQPGVSQPGVPQPGIPQPGPRREPRLGPAEAAVLRVLIERAGKVTGRHELNRLAGLDGTHRRCDAALVLIRRCLGEGAIVTVRRRGWMLNNEAVEGARVLLDSSS